MSSRWSDVRSITQSKLVLKVSTFLEMRMTEARGRATRMFQLMGRTMMKKSTKVMILERI